MVQDLNCVQMRVSGCIYHYKAVLGVGAKAKTVTNNLPILSVLGLGLLLICPLIQFFILSTNQKSRWDGLEGSFAALGKRGNLCVLQMCLTAKG
jgi:hypothetical protein